MRVLFQTELSGGEQVLTSHYLPALRDRGIDVRLLACAVDRYGEEEWDGIPVRQLPLLNAVEGRDIQLIAELRRELSAFKQSVAPDLVHMIMTAPSIYFERLTRSTHPCPTLLAFRFSPTVEGAGENSLLRAALSSAAFVTANSEAIADDVRRLAPDTDDRLSVIRNALPEPPLAPSPLSTEPPTLLCLGRLVHDKGFDVALDAFALVAARFPSARLIVAGDGLARDDLMAQTAELGIARKVEFVGWIASQAVWALINRATLMVVPSRWREAFGLVALQAMLMARPVVATRVGGLPEVVSDGEAGLLVESENPRQMADAICSLIADAGRARELGARARRSALDRFGFESYVDAHVDLYEQLCA